MVVPTQHRLISDSQNRGSVSSNWSAIPQEIWHTIFSYLGIKDLATVMRTCKALKMIAIMPSLWRSLSLNYIPESADSACSSTLLYRTTLKIVLFSLPSLQRKINGPPFPQLVGTGFDQILDEVQKTQYLFIASKFLDFFRSNLMGIVVILETGALRAVVEKFDSILEEWKKKLNIDSQIDLQELEKVCDKWQKALSMLNENSFESYYDTDSRGFYIQNDLFVSDIKRNQARIELLKVERMMNLAGLHIFSFLDVNSLRSVVLVSRTFNQISNGVWWKLLCRRCGMDTEHFPIQEYPIYIVALKVYLNFQKKIRAIKPPYTNAIDWVKTLNEHWIMGAQQRMLLETLPEVKKSQNLFLLSCLMDFLCTSFLCASLLKVNIDLKPVVQEFELILEDFNSKYLNSKEFLEELKYLCEKWRARCCFPLQLTG